jgi:MATE family multidrug resistance protein
MLTQPTAPDPRTEAITLIRLAIPLVIGQVLLFSTNLVDTLLAGHLGPLVLGAVAIGSSVWMLPLMLLQGLMFAVPAMVSHLIGAGRRHDVGALFAQSLYLVFGVGILSLLALRGLAAPLVSLLQVEADLSGPTTDFLRAVAWGAPSLGIFMACRGLSDGLSMTKPAMWFGLLCLALLVPIGYALMYGAFGMPGLGAYGSGLAASAVTTLGALAFSAYVVLDPAYRGIGWAARSRWPQWATLRALLALGLPMAMSVVMEVSLFSFASFAIARFGAVQVAAHQIALNVAGLTFMVPLGLSAAITVRVGDAMGAGDPWRARLAGSLGIGLSLVSQSISCAVFLLLPGAIAALYSNDPAVQAATVALLAFAGLFQLSDGVQVAANGALRGMKDTKIPAAITLLAYWGVGMPVGLLLAFPAGMAARGMWIGLLAALTVAAVLLTWRFRRSTLAAVQHGAKLAAWH